MSSIHSAAFGGLPKQDDPREAAEVDAADLQAMRNLLAGTAAPDEQKRFVAWLMRATAVRELEFRAGAPDLTAFAAGKRWIGMQFFTAAQSAITER